MKTILPTLLLLASVAFFRADSRAEERAPVAPQSALVEERAKLEELKQQFTESHPRVVEQRAKITALEKQVAMAPSPGRPPSEVRLSLDFPGGTIAELLTLLARNETVSFNLIGEKGLMSTVLPAFSLRNAQLTAFYEVLKRLLEARGFSLDLAGLSPDSLVCVLTQPEPRPKPRVVPPPLFESFQLLPYLEHQTVDDIVAAIRTAWELDPANKPEALQLKFHPPTKLLLVSGPPEAIMVAGKVISTLSGADKTVAEQKRLEAVAAELTRRRQVREKSERTPQEQEPKPPAKP